MARTLSRLGCAAAAMAALGGCAERLDHLGRPPTMTGPGAQIAPLPPISPERRAIARPAPTPAVESYAVASTWRSGPTSLFGDRRARSVGDILTVVIKMDEKGEIDTTTKRSRTGSDKVNVAALLGIPQVAAGVLPVGAGLDPAVDLSGSTSSTGTGAISRSESVELRVAATVVDVLPNGHFVIDGSQELRLNYELRELLVSGVIRPEDVSRRNEITYDKIADARISYGGRGQISDMQQPRYGQQVLDVVMPF